MGQSGWAGPLVVLVFRAARPAAAHGAAAGDVFASEDRFGTWRHLLVAVRSPRSIFAVKALTSLTVTVALLAASRGLVDRGRPDLVGNRPLPASTATC